jgi:peptide/nickel transport system substrate-binding protein
MELGQRIAGRMKELGLKQWQLAEKSGLTQQTVSQYVRGRFKPGYDAIIGLSEALEVSPMWFFGETEMQVTSPKPPPQPTTGDVILFPQSGKAPQERTFVIGHWFAMNQLPFPNHALSSGIARNFYELIFNHLVERLPRGQFRAALAVNWKPVENSWFFQLREGVQFHDGTPLTAEDVIFSYQQYLQLNPQERHIEGVERHSGDSIVVRLKTPCGLESVAMPFILPRGTSVPPSRFIGTGPFEAIELNPDFWRLRKNPHYFLSKPFFNEVQIRQYPHPQALEQALVDGKVHFAIRVKAPSARFITAAEPAAIRYHLHFMFDQPLVRNRAFRQAVALALDREKLAEVAGFPNPLYSSGPFDYFLGDHWRTPPQPHPQAAETLLGQVEGLEESPFRLSYTEQIPESLPLAEAIIAQLSEIGVHAVIGEPPHARLLIRPADPIEFEFVMWETGGQHNLNAYSNPRVDTLIKQLRQSPATPAQFLELRRLIQNDFPDVPLFYYQMPLTYIKTLRALENRMVALSCFNEIHTWYLDEEMEAGEVEAEEQPIVASASIT